jgi:Ni,Fe-hydrogenase III small subunit
MLVNATYFHAINVMPVDAGQCNVAKIMASWLQHVWSVAFDNK